MRLAAVVIGRNEGEKLPRCLSSVLGAAAPVVFVDSGSDDDSVQIARSMNVAVVELDPATAFTVARARNEGLAHALELDPDAALVQFVDADSEMVRSWFAHAYRALSENPAVAAVFGRVRERDPHGSLYARLYEANFAAHFQQSDAFPGMAMMRVAALRQAGGFNFTLLGCEDFELSFRLRRAGWLVRRLDAEMAVHELGRTSLRQWWQRQVRAGYVQAHEAALHGRSAERYSVRGYASIWFWGFVLPLLAAAAAIAHQGLALLLLAAYPVLWLRIHRRARSHGTARVNAALYATSCLLGKFPQLGGLLRFHAEHLGQQVRFTPRQP